MSILSCLSSAAHLGSLLVNERDREKAAAIQIEFSNKLIEAQAKLSELLGTIIEQQRLIPVLEQEIRDLKAKAAEKGRYELAKLGTDREFFVYRLRPPSELEERSREVEHFLCQPCFDAGKKVVLSGNGGGYWECPICKHGAQTTPAESCVVSWCDVDSRRMF